MPEIENFTGRDAWVLGRAADDFEGIRLDPDPEKRVAHYTVISVDDHVIEPPDVFTSRLPVSLRDAGPRVVEQDQREYWLIEGSLEPNIPTDTASGFSAGSRLGSTIRYDEMRRGAWDVHERIRDMDIDGIYASMGFPSSVWGFCGQRFMRMKDPELGLACVRAYNDWVINEWTGSYPDRLIPQQLPWLSDVNIAAQEIRQNAELGFKGVSFSENPEKLGLPSLHTGYWDPFVAACEETETVINLHVGSSSTISYPSTDAPLEETFVLFGVNALLAATDWIYSRIPFRFPNIKIAMSEGGIGWVPMLLDRLDYVYNRPRTEMWLDSPHSPAEILRRNFWFTTFYDPSIFPLRDRIGVDHITLETDYPHVDSTWPDSQAIFNKALQELPEDDIAKITHLNAAALYRHPIPAASNPEGQRAVVGR